MRRNFDSVVMLTWSDWHTEPRSNRYHYATQFAKRWPVFFVQTNAPDDSIAFEPVEGHNITIVRIAASHSQEQFARLCEQLRHRGISRPLVWVYNLFLTPVVARLHPALVVYHATEDYVSRCDKLAITPTDLSHLAVDTMQRVDFVVAVSAGVAETHRPVTDKPVYVLNNGCDFDFWESTGASNYKPEESGKVVLFQGGINDRLDYVLLNAIVERLPGWRFWFCGKDVDGGEGWQCLKKQPNVEYFGQLDSHGIARLAKKSLVGLIPFKDSDLMRRSLPLKAYEYLACGLPVVTVPIDALADEPDLFTAAVTAEEFADAIERVSPLRADPGALSARREAARHASYENRFSELLEYLDYHGQQYSALRPTLNILMLYDDGSTHVSTIMEHLEAFRLHSRHRFHFMPATGYIDFEDRPGAAPDFSCYDAIAIHYSVRVSTPDHLAPRIADLVAAYRGPKLLFIQDEYDQVETTRRCMERLGIDAVYTNVPFDSIDLVYPRARFTQVEFLPTLTGYVPEDPAIDDFVTPMAERSLRIGYRGRTLPHHYGALAREKYTIGVEVKRLAQLRGVEADIEVDSDKRIYGTNWYRFIGSARATLATESGSNVFDFDGNLARLAAEHHDMDFDTFAARFLGEHEGLVHMNQISPKVFESIRLRTALILFEGTYSGVVRPNEHYLPLKKDYSNIDKIFDRLEDVAFLEAMTERAYTDIIASGRYSLRTFVAGVDEYVSRRSLGRRRATIISAPALAIYGRGNYDLLGRAGPAAVLVNDTVLTPETTRSDLLTPYFVRFNSVKDQNVREDLQSSGVANTANIVPSLKFRIARGIWRLLPFFLRLAILKLIRRIGTVARQV